MGRRVLIGGCTASLVESGQHDSFAKKPLFLRKRGAGSIDVTTLMGLQGELGSGIPRVLSQTGFPKPRTGWLQLTGQTQAASPIKSSPRVLCPAHTCLRGPSAFSPPRCPRAPGHVLPAVESAWSQPCSPRRGVRSCRRGLLTCRSKHELFGPSEKVW